MQLETRRRRERETAANHHRRRRESPAESPESKSSRNILSCSKSKRKKCNITEESPSQEQLPNPNPASRPSRTKSRDCQSRDESSRDRALAAVEERCRLASPRLVRGCVKTSNFVSSFWYLDLHCIWPSHSFCPRILTTHLLSSAVISLAIQASRLSCLSVPSYRCAIPFEPLGPV
jgi:hypothetical protein